MLGYSTTKISAGDNDLIDLGLYISYDRVMEISTTIGNHVCNYYQQKEVVCPPNLREGLFTTAAIDNIDHNPSSTTATDALHGTGISLFQHPRNYGDGCERREHHVLVLKSATKKLSEYQCTSLELTKKDASIPKVDGPMKSDEVINKMMSGE